MFGVNLSEKQLYVDVGKVFGLYFVLLVIVGDGVVARQQNRINTERRLNSIIMTLV